MRSSCRSRYVERVGSQITDFSRLCDRQFRRRNTGYLLCQAINGVFNPSSAQEPAHGDEQAGVQPALFAIAGVEADRKTHVLIRPVRRAIRFRRVFEGVALFDQAVIVHKDDRIVIGFELGSADNGSSHEVAGDKG